MTAVKSSNWFGIQASPPERADQIIQSLRTVSRMLCSQSNWDWRGSGSRGRLCRRLQRSPSGSRHCCQGIEGISKVRHGQTFQGNMNIVRVSSMWADKDAQKFSTEAVTWRQLSHSNVLPFYGVYHPVHNTPRLCLVCPWMGNGNVVQFLADRTSNNTEVNCVPLVSQTNFRHWISSNTFYSVWMLRTALSICTMRELSMGTWKA